MVGVPGRSKACLTCKRRKRGCDQQRPTCGQCEVSGLQCQGYGKPRIFINSDQGDGDAKTYSFKPKSYSPLPLARSSAQDLPQKKPAWLSQTASSVLQRSLQRGASESKYFEIFWTSILPNGQAVSAQYLQYSTLGWVGVVQDLCHQDDLVRLALLASAIGLHGQQSGQQSKMMEGWRMYCRSLQVLAKSLPTRDPERYQSLHVTAMLLAYYELLQGSTTGVSSMPAPTWLRHAVGEKAIVSAQNPENYVSGPNHQLFEACRLHLIYTDLQNRKRSIFSSPKWKAAPWSFQPKSPKDQLLDILVEIPRVLEDWDEIECQSNNAERRPSLCQQLEERCWLYDSLLQAWSSTSGSTTIAFVEAQIATKNREHLEPSSVDFAMAHLGMIYWTTCILLYEALCYLTWDRQSKLPARIDPRQYCRKIALLISYFQNPGIGASFMSAVAFSAIAAVRFLSRHDSPYHFSEEHRMLLQSFRGIHRHKLMRFLGTWPWRTEREREIVRGRDVMVLAV